LQSMIDAHIHLSERKDDELNRYAERNGLAYTMGELLRLMARFRIEHGLLLSPPLRGGRPLPNEDLLKLCKKSDGRLSPVLTAEPSAREVSAAIKLAEQKRRQVRAFKIRLGYVEADAQSPVFQRLYDYAESAGIPLLFHTGDTATSTGSLARSYPLALDGLANEREDMVIVLCHFGNPWFEDVAELLYKHPNVYADISGLIAGGGRYAERYLDWLAKKISDAIYFAGGAEKIIFGTDYPVTTYSDALSLIERLEVDKRDKEMILGRNARRVYRL
jgi:predicted TIM-barrel fold metal-dependent hydrolase